MEHRVIYGILNNKLVHVSEVESGINCGVICPSCKSKLIAKKGKKNLHHFAHYNSEECKGGYETALHYAAKEIISIHKEFAVPEVYLNFHQSYKQKELIFNSRRISIDKVYLEKKVDDIIPDIIIESGGHKLLVEIFVTHKVDSEKLDKIRKIGISAIEIDLSKWSIEQDKCTLEDIIINGLNEKTWIYNRHEEKYYRQFMNKAKPFKSVYGYGANECPLNKYFWNGKSSSRWVDCIYCEYCISANDPPNCLGHTLISNISDLKKSYDELKRQYDIKECKRREDDIANNRCPRCSNGYLILRNGKKGSFMGCSNYPNCKFTISFKE